MINLIFMLLGLAAAVLVPYAAWLYIKSQRAAMAGPVA